MLCFKTRWAPHCGFFVSSSSDCAPKCRDSLHLRWVKKERTLSTTHVAAGEGEGGLNRRDNSVLLVPSRPFFFLKKSEVTRALFTIFFIYTVFPSFCVDNGTFSIEEVAFIYMRLCSRWLLPQRR